MGLISPPPGGSLTHCSSLEKLRTTFFPPAGSLGWSRSWRCRSTPRSLFSLSFILFFFFVGLDPDCSPCLATPGPRSYLGEAHFLGEISPPPPWAPHLSDEQLKHGRSLSAPAAYRPGRAPLLPPPSGLAALSTCIADITFSLFFLILSVTKTWEHLLKAKLFKSSDDRVSATRPRREKKNAAPIKLIRSRRNKRGAVGAECRWA